MAPVPREPADDQSDDLPAHDAGRSPLTSPAYRELRAGRRDVVVCRDPVGSPPYLALVLQRANVRAVFAGHVVAAASAASVPLVAARVLHSVGRMAPARIIMAEYTLGRITRRAFSPRSW